MAPRGKEYTPKKRASIIALHKEGLSVREIEKRGYGKKSAIANLIKMFNTEGRIEAKPRSGRPRTSTERDDKVLCRITSQNPFKGSTQLSVDWRLSTGTNASARTVRRRLCDCGLKGYRPAKKPLLSAFQRARRLKYARKYQGWSLQQWRKVKTCLK